MYSLEGISDELSDDSSTGAGEAVDQSVRHIFSPPGKRDLSLVLEREEHTFRERKWGRTIFPFGRIELNYVKVQKMLTCVPFAIISKSLRRVFRWRKQMTLVRVGHLFG